LRSEKQSFKEISQLFVVLKINGDDFDSQNLQEKYISGYKTGENILKSTVKLEYTSEQHIIWKSPFSFASIFKEIGQKNQFVG